MSLFDIVKEKAAQLFSGAGDKVNEMTGVDLPGTETTDQLARSADTLSDTATTTAADHADTAQGLGQTATGAAQDITGTATEAADNAVTDPTDPRR